MTYLKRKIDAFLEKWKREEDKKPLIVKGPRQVGKTESIRQFGKKNYEHVIEINFVEGKTLIFLMNCRNFRKSQRR